VTGYELKRYIRDALLKKSFTCQPSKTLISKEYPFQVVLLLTEWHRTHLVQMLKGRERLGGYKATEIEKDWMQDRQNCQRQKQQVIPTLLRAEGLQSVGIDQLQDRYCPTLVLPRA